MAKINRKFVGECEVAEVLNGSKYTLRNDRSQNRGLPYYRCGRRILYDLDEVLEYIEMRKVVPGQAE